MKHENEELQDEIHAVIRMQDPDTPDDGWLSTNESVETVLDFEMLSEQLERAIDDAHRWKWGVIALHSGLQGMMVLALKGSDYMNVIRQDDKKRCTESLSENPNSCGRSYNILNIYLPRTLYIVWKRMLTWVFRRAPEVSVDERRGKSPRNDLKLIDFLKLYAWIKGDKMLRYTDSQKFVPKGTQGRSIKQLNRLRNKFVHFTPKVWRLDLGGLPEIASDCLEIAEFLAWESGNVLWHEAGLRDRLESAFKSAIESLCVLGQHGLQNDDTKPPV